MLSIITLALIGLCVRYVCGGGGLLPSQAYQPVVVAAEAVDDTPYINTNTISSIYIYIFIYLFEKLKLKTKKSTKQQRPAATNVVGSQFDKYAAQCANLSATTTTRHGHDHIYIDDKDNGNGAGRCATRSTASSRSSAHISHRLLIFLLLILLFKS